MGFKDLLQKTEKSFQKPQSNILDDLTQATIDTEGLISGQTPLRITNEAMRRWKTIQGIPIDVSAKIPYERRNFFFVKPGQESKVIRRQYKNYFLTPQKYGLTSDSTIEDMVRIFDQQNPQNKLNLLQKKGIDIKQKLNSFGEEIRQFEFSFGE